MTTPTLKVTDSADSTGAIATVTGGDSDAANTIYTLQWCKTTLLGEWTLAGARVGPGDVALGLDKGIYFGHVVSAVSGAPVVSRVIQFGVTDGLDPIHYRCLLAMKDMVLALSLPGIVEENTEVQKYPVRIKEVLKARSGSAAIGAIVSPISETRTRHDNNRDELGYGVQVALFRASNQQLQEGLPEDLGWREQLSDALSQTLFPGVPEIHTVDCQPGPIMMPEAFGSQYDVSATMFRCYTNKRNAIYLV